jgi:predicted RNA methylase
MKNPFPPATPDDLARVAPMLSLMAGLEGSSRFASALLQAFNLVKLDAETRGWLEGPVVVHSTAAWPVEHGDIPRWMMDRIAAERLEIVMGQHPGMIVGPCEIAAVMESAIHTAPLTHQAGQLYLWASSRALQHRTREDGTPNPVSLEEAERMLGSRLPQDAEILTAAGMYHQDYRSLCAEIRRKVAAGRGTRLAPGLRPRPAPLTAPSAPPKTVSVPSEVAAVLATSTCEGNVLKLPQQLDRPVYEATDKVLKALGGKWNRHKGGHVFPEDPAPLIAKALGDGAVIDRKKTLEIFETPPEVAARMVGMLPTSERLLEPSAGTGRLVKAALLAGSAQSIQAIEVDPRNIAALRDIADSRVAVLQADFLSVASDTTYDACVMNPPFRNGADIAHVQRAFELLRPGGTLVAIMGAGAFTNENRRAKAFQAWLHDIGPERVETDTLPAGTFRQEGTDVVTRLIQIRKP